MRLAIMQPYFMPYIGYFQLINAVDEFVIYDNIEFTKKGWINRNRILVNGIDALFTLPLKKDSDYLHVKDRFLSDSWPQERVKVLNRFRGAYQKAPYFNDVFPMIEEVVNYQDPNLFSFIFNSLLSVTNYLDIKTPFTIASSIDVDHTLKSEEKVLALCSAKNADTYINPIGGVELYNKETFAGNGIDLQFLRTGEIIYTQFDHQFVPHLSIIDMLMFNSKEQIKGYLNQCEVGYQHQPNVKLI